MNIEVKKTADGIVIAIAGRMDTNTAPTLEKVISEEVSATDKLVLDFQNLAYISSAGLRVLLSAQKKMRDMKLINVQEAVMEVFEMTGFADILVIE